MAKKRRRKKVKLESFTFYSLRDLPNEVRSEFTFRNPNLKGAEKTLEFFQSMGIIHYRDNLYPSPLFIPCEALRAVTTPSGIVPESPFTAYVYQASADQEADGTITVKRRVTSRMAGARAFELEKERLAKYGDDLWWDRWASKVSVAEMSSFKVICR